MKKPTPDQPRLVPPPRPLETADLSSVEAVFTDVDGTLTTANRLESGTVLALERLKGAGLKVVLVSGRPAGWGECWARTLPVDGVIVENGGLYFARDAAGRLEKVYAQKPGKRKTSRARLLREVKGVLGKVKGARLSSDSAYTEVDIAIDHAEEAHLAPRDVDRLEGLLRARKVTAVRSSVHINCWVGEFDKLSSVRMFVEREWKLTVEPSDPRFVYVGDSFNDAPMFKGFALSIGVSNVRDVLERISHPPAYIASAPEGRGFQELVTAILEQKGRGSPAAVTAKNEIVA